MARATHCLFIARAYVGCPRVYALITVRGKSYVMYYVQVLVHENVLSSLKSSPSDGWIFSDMGLQFFKGISSKARIFQVMWNRICVFASLAISVRVNRECMERDLTVDFFKRLDIHRIYTRNGLLKHYILLVICFLYLYHGQVQMRSLSVHFLRSNPTSPWLTFFQFPR
jgi:hypothetical protein